MEFRFPPQFLWGTATSAHQVEGGNVNNDYWLMEHTPDSPFVVSSGDACDHYSRYREDIALIAELGFNLYRFSLEWSRIEPEAGEFSRAQLEHYRRVLATCHEYGLTPMVTFHHFTSPRWLAADGGWEADTTPERFARYCERTIAYLGDLIPLACTLNEINIGALLHSMQIPLCSFDPWFTRAARSIGCDPACFRPFFYADPHRARTIALSAHRRAVEVLKAGPGKREVGLTLSLPDIQSVPGGEELARYMRHDLQTIYLEPLRDDDFVGVQTYSRQIYGPRGLEAPGDDVEKTLLGVEYYPEALEQAIRYAHRIANIPVFVTENGIGTKDDRRRHEYIERALQGVSACLNDDIDVRGYIYWPAMDDFAWMYGYQVTSGLIAVDRETQERSIKPSARWLGHIARASRTP